MPSALITMAGLIAIGLAFRWLKAEWLRVNTELERQEAADAKLRSSKAHATLRRDPQSGEWRVGG